MSEEPPRLVEPTTTLIYIARALAAKYGVPCRVVARGDSGGAIGLEVFTWRNNAWVIAEDGLDQLNAITCPESIEKPADDGTQTKP